MLQKIKSKFAILGLALLLIGPTSAKADLFGGDVAVLAQILAENIKQYYQLKSIIEEAEWQHSFLENLNDGLNNSIGMLEGLPIRDEKILEELRSFRDAVGKVNSIYGKIPKSQEEAMQALHDQSIAESFRMVNDFKEYSKIQEENSQRIAIESREASPKGAARMQAETSAQILNSLSQLIRLNTQMLKLQSEQFGMTNKSGKESVANFQKVNRDLGKSFKEFKPSMDLIKF